MFIYLFCISGERGAAGGAMANMTADQLLFGSPTREPASQSDIDLLSDVFGDSQSSQDDQNSFSSKWNELFGDSPRPQMQSQGMPSAGNPEDHPGYLPSDLMDSLLNMDPFGRIDNANKQQDTSSSNAGSNNASRNPLSGLSMPSKASLKSLTSMGKSGKDKPAKGNNDQSAWFNLFSDLDPLANPDAIGQGKKKEDERSC